MMGTEIFKIDAYQAEKFAKTGRCVNLNDDDCNYYLLINNVKARDPVAVGPTNVIL